MTILEALRQVTTSIKTWADEKFLNKNEATADDFGVYVQDIEPQNAVDGDIWIDTAHDAEVIDVDIPDALPNPSAITFSGAVQGYYDGSEPVDIEIPTYTETDPTVPSWAKASTKPTYSKSEIGLGNVDNVKQYSASNPPPYPVTSVNGETGAITVSALPAVTASDNGKVLMVVNGSWKAVDLNMSIDANGVLYV